MKKKKLLFCIYSLEKEIVSYSVVWSDREYTSVNNQMTLNCSQNLITRKVILPGFPDSKIALFMTNIVNLNKMTITTIQKHWWKFAPTITKL